MYNIYCCDEISIKKYGTEGEILYVCCLSILKWISMNFGKPNEQST